MYHRNNHKKKHNVHVYTHTRRILGSAVGVACCSPFLSPSSALALLMLTSDWLLTANKRSFTLKLPSCRKYMSINVHVTDSYKYTIYNCSNYYLLILSSKIHCTLCNFNDHNSPKTYMYCKM